MKTYCKRLVVSDVERIFDTITDYMHDKYRKNSTIRFYACYTGTSKRYIKEHMRPRRFRLTENEKAGYRGSIEGMPGDELWKYVNLRLATDMADAIRNRTVREHILECNYGLPVIRYEKIVDKGSGKERVLGLETVLFRLYEQLAQTASAPLFNAKVGIFQVASIKGRGQSFGKKVVQKWLSTDVDGTRYCIKADVKHCYPSIPHSRLRELFHRDLRKCSDLLYLYDLFLDLYEEWPNPDAEDPKRGILIGSPASKDMCNYYLSYAYHYAEQELVKTVRRRGRETVKHLFQHQIYYMDDITLYGSNKNDLRAAMKMLQEYFDSFLGLTIKGSWTLTKSMYEDRGGERKGNLLDYMGFRFHGGAVREKNYYGRMVRVRRTWITIRRRIFLQGRRKIRKLLKKVRRHIVVNVREARAVTSVFGWYKNTDMDTYRSRNRVDQAIRIARKIVSDYGNGKPYKTEKYFDMWRRLYA